MGRSTAADAPHETAVGGRRDVATAAAGRLCDQLPRVWQQGSVATDEGRGGEGGRRPAAAEISAPCRRSRGVVAAEAAEWPR